MMLLANIIVMVIWIIIMLVNIFVRRYQIKKLQELRESFLPVAQKMMDDAITSAGVARKILEKKHEVGVIE